MSKLNLTDSVKVVVRRKPKVDKNSKSGRVKVSGDDRKKPHNQKRDSNGK